MPLRFIFVTLYVFVFATGAAGLIYQVTWQKYLSRLLGSDTAATAIILGTFLGGLSFGYYLCGRITQRVKNHFRVYALLEGIIGAWCFFFPYIFKVMDLITRSWSFSLPLTIIVQGLLCSALLMGVPTVCMGATIPFLTRGISKNIREASTIHARVYAINTGGAFIGALMAGFYLIPKYGLPTTVAGTACLNLGACMFFWLLSKGTKEIKTSKIKEESRREDQDTSGFPPWALYFIAFLSGFYVMTLENVLIRISNLSLGSSSYSFSIVISVFILSIAVGSYLASRLQHMPTYLLFTNQLLITLSLLLIYVSLDTWPYWAHVIRITVQSNATGFWGYYGLVFLVLTGILVVPVSLMGATVPIAFHEIKRELKKVGRDSGSLFSWNCAGNLTGSLIGGIVFYYFFNNAGVFLSAVVFAALSTCIAGWYLSWGYFLPAALIGISIFLFTLHLPFYNENNFMEGTFRIRSPLAYSFSGPENFFREFHRQKDLKFYKDGPSATVAVIEYPDHPLFIEKPRSIMVNGKSDSSTIADIYTLKLSAHIPCLLSEKTAKIMVIGLGTGVTAGELTLYPEVEDIDVAEISPSVVEALPLFRQSTHGLDRNPIVRIHTEDAFRIMGRSKKKWDIVISEPSNPWVTGVDLLFTQEFYKLVREHLTPNGMLVQWAQIYATDPSILGMILNTVHQEFRQCRVFMASRNDLIILASNKDLSIKDLNRAEERLRRNKRVKSSLAKISIESIDSILIREIWSPSYISDNFFDLGIQTMDNPKLHYMAGKSFFMGNRLADNDLLGPGSSFYFQEYLMAKKYEEWAGLSFSKKHFDSLLNSARNKVYQHFLPMAPALKLKAYLGEPALFTLSDKEKQELGVKLVPFITEYHPKKDWESAGIGGASIRGKAEILLNHLKRYRNWIVPYPLDGLKHLLKEGISSGRDEYEKSWCSQQLKLLLAHERTDHDLIKKLVEYQ